MRSLWLGIAGALIGISLAVAEDGPLPEAFDEIQTIVVIFQENRSYVHLLPDFPGASGIADAPETALLQRDRDGSVLPYLPPLWTTDKVAPDFESVEPHRPDPAYPASMPNAPFFTRRAALQCARRHPDPGTGASLLSEPDADQRWSQ